ncbi:MAG: NAD(P)/FAD-dependent oxidoreductase [Desulfobulbaceae bacterium]|nr:NAD(P)/FAD-dependent oxidoreductase [Desulfobulbaceae bacterium]
MAENIDILVIGAGPGGLACATLLAQQGANVALVERKAFIGPKVCAGGITWGGLIKHVPPGLIERGFPQQHVITRLQRVVVAETNPIIATISRERLGQWMADQAREAGVTILTQTRALALEKHRVILETGARSRRTLGFDHLVGADGSHSLVRRFLGLPTTAMGIGLNCMLPGRHPQMEWHLHTGRFGYGYGWIFPHAEVVSIGAYGDVNNLSARVLKQRLLSWAAERGFQLDPAAMRAGWVNFDYRGVRFDRTWLVGDAAGLASGLTGEGIYPALVSGQAVARMILDPKYPATELIGLANKHRRHRRIVDLAARQRPLCGLMLEILAVLLRLKILDFRILEMAE